MTNASAASSRSFRSVLSWINQDRRYTTNKWREKLLMEIVWRLPHDLVYWTVIRAVVENFDNYPADVKVGDVLGAWGRPRYQK